MRYAVITAAAILLGFALYAKIDESRQSSIPEQVRAQFQHWKLTEHRLYASPSEDEYRLTVFYQNLQMINAHNAAGHSHTLAINQFADLTSEEFLAKFTGGPIVNSPRPDQPPAQPSTLGLPGSVDWTTRGVVTPVKLQGQCGACWAFSTTGALEGIKALTGHGLTSLSEQQLIDCTLGLGNHGCSGGTTLTGFNYVIRNGIEPESAYPFKARNGPCRANRAQFVPFKIHRVGWAPKHNNNALLAGVARQPVSTSIESHALQFYHGGIISQGCGQAVDHSVLIVGYGNQGGLYWKLKNSWGPRWGEQGYFRVKRITGIGVTPCGLNIYPEWPLV